MQLVGKLLCLHLRSKMKTINRLCFCCAGKEGAVYPLGYHFIAGVGEVDMTIRICARCGSDR